MNAALDESDEALMLAYAGGDASAFARLYDRHERPVHRYFLRQAVAPAEADDLLQETWMAVVANAAGYRVDARFTTWLYTVARSKLVDHWRRTRRAGPFDEAANDADGDGDDPVERIAGSDAWRPDVQAMSRQQAAAFVDAVAALPAPQREAFLLHVDGGLSLAQMATLTSVGTETAKSRLRYAMKRMRTACAEWLDPLHDGTPSIEGARDEA